MANLNLLLNILNISHFHNLALFVCHLFIGGNFRIGHILYDPKVFDDHLISKIDSVCQLQIPWLTTDITQHSLMPPHVSKRTDHILQVIFFDPKYLAEEIVEYEEHFTFYRIFAFPSTFGEVDMKQRISIIGQLNSISNPSPLIMHYNVKSDLIYVHRLSENGLIIENFEKNMAQDVRSLYEHRQKSNVEYERLFDGIFGEYDRKQTMGIRVSGVFRTIKDSISYVPIFGHLFFANYFVSTLNASFIHMTSSPFNDKHTAAVDRLVAHKPRKYHEEIFLEYEPIDETKL